MTSNPGFLFGPGPDGRCDDLKVGGAAVVEAPGQDGWVMWYYCRDRAFDPAAPPTLGSGRVALARSDDGLAWRRIDGPQALGSVLAPSDDAKDFDSLHLGLGDVLRVGRQWFMWYFGGDRALRANRSTMLGDVVGLGLRPGLAVSDDGVAWRKVRGPTPSGALLEFAPDQLYAGWPNVFHDGEAFVMQYTAPTLAFDHFATMTARSADGVRWSAGVPLRWSAPASGYNSGGEVTRHVISNPGVAAAGRWLMLYTAADAEAGFRRSIAAAHSDDGEVWTRWPGGPLLEAGSAGSWDDGGVALNRIVPFGGGLRLYYYGFRSLGAGEGPRGIGLATSDNGDLRRFERWEADGVRR